MKERIIEFVRKKDFKFLKNIGQGGTGKTILILDENIDEKFVCKKYSPYYQENKESYYPNFVEEIKIMHRLNNMNVVRVFNYYLYPELVTGYILMEYIEGSKIDEFAQKNPELINDLFRQTINGFKYIEENKILHRDVRPDNILVSNEGIVKIIDFGFGKKMEFQTEKEKSISLNWRYPKPLEFTDSVYDFTTEVYFIGKLFEEIIEENNLQNFAYSSVLEEMINSLYEKRICSFFEVDRRLIDGDSFGIEFPDSEKETYRKFATALTSMYKKIEHDSGYQKNLDVLIRSLEDIYRNSILEEHVQNPFALMRCFIRGNYYYSQKDLLPIDTLRKFIELMSSSPLSKRRIIMNNLWQRLDAIKRYVEESDDLPF